MSEPTPVVALDYSDPKRAAAEPVLRVVGTCNATLGGFALLGLAITLLSPAFNRYGYSRPPGELLLPLARLATAALQLSAGVGLLRRTTWGVRATAGWAVASVAVQVLGIAVYAGRYYGFRGGNVGYVALAVLSSLATAAAPIAYAVVCGAVVWWRPEVTGRASASGRG